MLGEKAAEKRNIKFSIIIPVYNSSEYLGDCLESAVRQTYKNIEIICIDDASEDDSLKILEKYCETDERIHVIAKSRNGGTSKARKDGVLLSKGEYILFLDADDQLMINACERLLDVCEKGDIIQFAVQVKGCSGVEEEKVSVMKRYFQPFCQDISMEKARELCFYSSELAHNLCGKMFNGDICRKSFFYITDERLIMAEDLYAYFVIAIFSKSYIGIPDELYLYNYGPGITGEISGLFKTLQSYCMQSQISEKCKEVLLKIGELGRYERYIEKIRNKLLETSMNFIMYSKEQIQPEDLKPIQKMLSENWEKEDLGYTTAYLGMQYQRLNMYHQKANMYIKEKGWVFPYESIPQNARIVIYGAGDMGKDYYNQIIRSGYCKIVAWVDKAYDMIGSNEEYSLLSPELIKTITYDYIVIAIRNDNIKSIVKNDLINMGVKEDKLI